MSSIENSPKHLESNEKWTRASFGVYGDAFDPGEINALLDVEPSRVFLKGDLIGPRSGDRRRRHSAWLLNSPLSENVPMELDLAWLLDILEPRRDQVQALAQKYKVIFFCGFSSENGQGGFTITSAMLARLAKLGIDFSLDLYPPGVSRPGH
jgi:hypothetical protein